MIRQGLLLPGQFIVPGPDADFDRAGNVVRRVYNVILSDLGAQFDRANNSTRASRAKRRKRRNSARRGQFFIRNRSLGGRQGDSRSGLPDGIWEKRPDGELFLWFNIVKAAPVYRPRLGLRIEARRLLPGIFNAEFSKAVGVQAARRIGRRSR